MQNRSMVWKAVSYGAGAAAMLVTRRVLGAVWKETRGGEPPRWSTP
jgi:hypothetical protein